MKIIIIGATGTIGKHITKALQQDHEVIKVGSTSGDLQVDISSSASIENLFKQVGSFDALISTTGNGHFGPLKTMTEKDFRVGLDSKLMGQINLVLIGQHYINPKGSFTLTSGILSDDPVLLGANLSAVNGAINGFVRAAAIELENGIRINTVSPGVVEESPVYFPYFQGHIPVTMDRVTQAYVKSALGALTGQVFQVV
ncbi:NAD(P)-dependent dehydrogenase, short-chain alcohol dehydrogenase family [Mucilaginibacter pineti]|uniref:NAD(P)-dependent dehydrogenase, short-chain alcohol dehydrogenase family n=1 Tax=Mucilaginibacter pineti TaxID=1391627 RepID=A0A1G6TBI5_9SPHI|nr:short chain dehydrogenase [Mucilaginibacter pineti]SDD26440.1 NAD(P)-dependent dehydrogenase, short-chain alcohol dehydrogenase family [Mucilaginibacter pineti]